MGRLLAARTAFGDAIDPDRIRSVENAVERVRMAVEPAIRVEELDALRRLDTCTVSNAIETFQVRMRNAGFADGCVKCIFDDLPPMVGYAATARLRTGEPPIAGFYDDRADWWKSILQIPAPRIPILEDLDERPGVGSTRMFA